MEGSSVKGAKSKGAKSKGDEDANRNWTSVSMKIPLLLQVRRALRTTTAQEMGLTNQAEFLEMSVRELLGKIEAKRFTLMEKVDDTVSILDNRVEPLGRIIRVVFSGEDAWCEYCEEYTCVHVQYVWLIPEVKEALEKRGLTRPPSRPPRMEGGGAFTP